MTKNQSSRNGSFDIETIKFILLPVVTPECTFLSSAAVFNDAISDYLFSNILKYALLFRVI